MPTEPYVTEEVLENIRRFLSDKPTENGGVIMACGKKVIRFIPDTAPLVSNEFEYAPNVRELNLKINEFAEKEKLEFAGFVHSHTNNTVISDGDKKYMQDILSKMSKSSLVCGIFNASTKEIKWYSVTH